MARISFYTGLSFKELPDLQKPLPANEAFGQSAKWRVSDKTKGNSFDGTPRRKDSNDQYQNPHAFRVNLASPVQTNKSSNAVGDVTEKVMIGYKTWNRRGDVIAFAACTLNQKIVWNRAFGLFLANPELQQVVGPLDISPDGLP